jgi:putative nucleotidyltransferase with HDIG domain
MIENQKASQDETIMEILEEKVDLTQGLESKNAELERSYWDMVETLIGVIEARDQFTGGHSVKVCEYSVKLAKKLGYNDEEVSDIMKASILHDIGKMGIPDNILLKQGTLSNDEYDVIMNHPEIGCRILSKVRGLENILPMILYHHERVDGTGYPYGLKGDKIPSGARIIAIADAYDAMTSNRPYRKALDKDEVIAEVKRCSGTQFHPVVVEAYLKAVSKG